MLKEILYHIQYKFNLITISFVSIFFINKTVKTKQFGRKPYSWFVPKRRLSRSSIVYSVGVGYDISFDLDLIKAYGTKIFAFDPTEKSKEFLKTIKLPKEFIYKQVGVWNKDKKMKFFAPMNENYVSHSITNLYKSSSYFRAQCYKIATIMKKNKHKNIDLLKLDVEGAEYAILNDIFKSKIYPKILLVEFDQPIAVYRTISMILKIKSQGYKLVKRDAFNFTFIQ